MRNRQHRLGQIQPDHASLGSHHADGAARHHPSATSDIQHPVTACDSARSKHSRDPLLENRRHQHTLIHVRSSQFHCLPITGIHAMHLANRANHNLPAQTGTSRIGSHAPVPIGVGC